MITKREKLPASGRTQRKANLLVFLSAAVLAAAVAGTSRWLPDAAASAFFVRGTGGTSPRLQQAEEILQLVVGDGGFEPAQVTRRAGKILLSADDRRGDKSQRLTLRLSRE